MTTTKVRATNMTAEINDELLQELYTWVDAIPLSRPKKNMSRDFSDGVLAAEVVKHHFPKLVELHNYSPKNATADKKMNWNLLNRKVFKKLNFELSDDVVSQIVSGQPWVIENVLIIIRTRIDRALFEKKKQNDTTEYNINDQPEVDQNTKDTEWIATTDPAPPPPDRYAKADPKKGGKALVQGAKPSHQRGVVGTKAPQQAQAQQGHQPTVSGNLISETVPKILLEEKEQECLAKEETVQILQAKVRRLEHLLHLKDIRIDDLQSRLDQTRPTGRKK